MYGDAMAVATCQNCGTENPASARFCMSCGAQQERRCWNCGAVAPPEARFCMECGSSLEGEQAPAPAAPQAARPAAIPPEERRQVTVLFADLSGYTAASEGMDPEQVKVLVDGALRRLVEEVDRFGGTVDKYIGDNVMALFGAPVAHEDDAERAVRAGLGMQAAMGEINERLSRTHGTTFALRVGVNSGEVVAGAVGDAYTVVGDAVNVASRLQSAAERGSVTVGERTMRATGSAIEYRELEPLTLKGKAQPVPAWEAIEPAAAHPRRRATDSRSPLVGRTHELDLLESLAQRVARERRAHLVTVVGEAGVGKSRLLDELRRRLGDAPDSPVVHVGRCPAYGSAVVYWALGEVLREEFEIADGDSAEAARQKLTDGVEQRLDPEEASRQGATIARLLGIGSSQDSAAGEEEDPQRLRESFFAAVRALLEAIANERPLVIAFEDIHWADDGMLDLIEHLAQRVRAPLLMLCLTRDALFDRRADWGTGRRNATSLGLEPLTDDEVRELVSALLPATDNGAAALVAERSEGNPLFAEEMVRLAEEGGEGNELPDSVQGVLAARLDSLPPFERQLVQHAAVSGRTFWPGSLATVAQREGGDLDEALRSLEDKDFLVGSSGPARLSGERELGFKHVLIRDVAYGMLPKAVRARRHFEVARYVEERAGDRADEVVGLLAEHYGRAAALAQETHLEEPLRGQLEVKALELLETAGDGAAALYSNAEAFDHYSAAAGLEATDAASRARLREKQGDMALLLGRVDPAIEAWEECLEHHSGDEDQARLGDLNRKVGAALWQKGAVKEAIERYQRGIGLLKDGPPALELVRLYEEAATLYMHTGDNMLAIYAAEKALRLAERLEEAGAASRAHEVFGRVFGRMGDGAKARENLERSVEIARSSGPDNLIRALIALGSHLDMSEADYGGAAAAYSEARELARRVGDLAAEAELQSALALVAAYRADWDEVAALTEASLELAEREGLARSLAYPYALRGLLRWRAGEFDRAEETYRRALAIAEETGWSEVAYWALFGLALTLRDSGDLPGALEALAQALGVCERAGLVAQSIQANAARAVNLMLAGERDQAVEVAAETSAQAERLPYPAARAASLQATGACTLDPGALAESRALWEELGRPLDAAWCDVLTAQVAADARPDAAREAIDRAVTTFERLGVGHMAERARALVRVA
jgi:adenylate cyclase